MGYHQRIQPSVIRPADKTRQPRKFAWQPYNSGFSDILDEDDGDFEPIHDSRSLSDVLGDERLRHESFADSD